MEKRESAIKLEWNNFLNESVSEFIIEKRISSDPFEIIARQENKGVGDYAYFDYSPCSSAKIISYRKKWIDDLGKANYSEIISIILDGTPVLIFPNPVEKPQSITIHIINEMTISIFSSQGKLILTFKNKKPGEILKHNVSDLLSGLYFIKLDSSQGSHYERLIIQE